MTQAELAGGTIVARQASPAKGQLIRDFTLDLDSRARDLSFGLSRAF